MKKLIWDGTKFLVKKGIEHHKNNNPRKKYRSINYRQQQQEYATGRAPTQVVGQREAQVTEHQRTLASGETITVARDGMTKGRIIQGPRGSIEYRPDTYSDRRAHLEHRKEKLAAAAEWATPEQVRIVQQRIDQDEEDLQYELREQIREI